MKFQTSKPFEEDFKKLPSEIRKAVSEKFRLWQADPNYPSLRIKKMKGHKGIWEGHITVQYVFTFEWRIAEDGERLVLLRRIGTHQVYEKP